MAHRRGITLMPRPAATTRSAASKLETITRQLIVCPARAAARCSIVCGAVLPAR